MAQYRKKPVIIEAMKWTGNNISDIIRQKRMVYGTDIVETDKEGKKKFASVFSVKSFQDLTLNQVDKILQLPIELVITETLSFADNKFVVQKFTEQKDITALSEDVDLAYISGLDELVSAERISVEPSQPNSV